MPDNRKPLIYGAFPVCRHYTVRAHLRDDGPAKRGGRKNGVLHAGPLLRGLHAGHLRPCDHRRPTQSRPDDGQYPIPCGIDLSATRSRWGQRLGQKKAVPKNGTYKKQKSSKSDDFEDFWQAIPIWIFSSVQQLVAQIVDLHLRYILGVFSPYSEAAPVLRKYAWKFLQWSLLPMYLAPVQLF